jgi:hypothetical protein
MPRIDYFKVAIEVGGEPASEFEDDDEEAADSDTGCHEIHRSSVWCQFRHRVPGPSRIRLRGRLPQLCNFLWTVIARARSMLSSANTTVRGEWLPCDETSRWAKERTGRDSPSDSQIWIVARHFLMNVWKTCEQNLKPWERSRSNSSARRSSATRTAILTMRLLTMASQNLFPRRRSRAARCL